VVVLLALLLLLALPAVPAEPPAAAAPVLSFGSRAVIGIRPNAVRMI
jgi:hypothetical protein